MRYFISIDVDDEQVTSNIMNFMDAVSGHGDINPVYPENLHITLLFIGYRDDGEVDELRERFVHACEEIRFDEFMCNIEGVGVFPHMNYIEVVWASAKPYDKLYELHMNFSEHINGENKHEFTPHVTVGRVRDVDTEEKERLQQVIESYPGEFGAFTADRVRLKQSETGEDGPVYRDIEVYEL